MSELPPEIAVEPEPTDADPPPEAIRPDRPRIWPEEPRAPRPQIKRPMEEWLSEFEARVRDQPAPPREQGTRRRRPRGLARILPAAQPAAGAVQPTASRRRATVQPATSPARARPRSWTAARRGIDSCRRTKRHPTGKLRRRAVEFAGIEWASRALA